MKKIFFLVFFIFVFQNVQAENPGLSGSYENEIVETVKNVLQTKEVKGEIERPICATPIFLEIKTNWDRFSAKTNAILESYTERPTFGITEHTYDTPHFRIHYVTQGDSAVPSESWVDTCGQVLEHVWDAEINFLGYNEPPGDGWYPEIIDGDTTDNGGDGRYDVYLIDLSLQYLGYTQGEYFLSGQSLSATSFIVLDNDYIGYSSIHSQIEWLEVTFAHEFFHAIQMGYDATEYEYENGSAKPYWMEMSAVWMEEMVYDDVNDYRNYSYLSAFFDEPWLSLKTFRSNRDYHPYGSCVWPIFLSERFDTLIIKDIWEKCAEKANDNVLEATDAILRVEARGSTFEDAFREFTVWNYFTADRARTELFYSEGDSFPVKVKVDIVHTTYPVDVTSIPHPPENLGSNYMVFVPHPDSTGGMKIDFIGQDADYKVSVLGYMPYPLLPFDTTIFLDPFSMTGTLDFYNWDVYNEIVMIPVVTTRSPDSSWAYEYHATYDSSLHGESPLPQEDKILQNYPNPFVIETEFDSTFFPFILSSPSRVRVDIFTLGGERLKTLVPRNDPEYPVGEYLDRTYAVPWDGKNEKGEYVSSGIYLYRFRTDRTTKIKKLAVIR